MKARLIFLSVLCPFFFITLAQSFTVLAVKGRPMSLLGSKSQILSTGKKISGQFTVHLGKDEYVALMAENGRTVELQNEGIFKAEKISELSVSKGSTIGRFGTYVAEKLIKSSGQSKEMTTLGAVVRAGRRTPLIQFPYYSALVGDSVAIPVLFTSTPFSIVWRIINSDGRTIAMNTLTDTQLVINTAKLGLMPGRDYRLYLTALATPQLLDSASFSFIPENWARTITDSLQVLIMEPGFENSAVLHMSAGLIFERNNLNYIAGNLMEKAVVLSGGADGFLDHYLMFLIHNGMEKKAGELLSTYRTGAK